MTIQVDPKSFDLDKLRKHFDFELVLEDEDGFVIVATEDVSLGKLQKMVDAYSSDTYGSATVASIYSIDDDEGQVERLRRILAPRLFFTQSDSLGITQGSQSRRKGVAKNGRYASEGLGGREKLSTTGEVLRRCYWTQRVE